jgi:hypothetical protein
VYQGCFSLVVCGSDHFRWTAYAFHQNQLEDDEKMLRNPEEEEEENPFAEDPIGASGNSVDANCPIRDPRSYYLTAFERRVARIAQE